MLQRQGAAAAFPGKNRRRAGSERLPSQPTLTVNRYDSFPYYLAPSHKHSLHTGTEGHLERRTVEHLFDPPFANLNMTLAPPRRTPYGYAPGIHQNPVFVYKPVELKRRPNVLRSRHLSVDVNPPPLSTAPTQRLVIRRAASLPEVLKKRQMALVGNGTSRDVKIPFVHEVKRTQHKENTLYSRLGLYVPVLHTIVVSSQLRRLLVTTLRELFPHTICVTKVCGKCCNTLACVQDLGIRPLPSNRVKGRETSASHAPPLWDSKSFTFTFDACVCFVKSCMISVMFRCVVQVQHHRNA